MALFSASWSNTQAGEFGACGTLQTCLRAAVDIIKTNDKLSGGVQGCVLARICRYDMIYVQICCRIIGTMMY